MGPITKKEKRRRFTPSALLLKSRVSPILGSWEKGLKKWALNKICVYFICFCTRKCSKNCSSFSWRVEQKFGQDCQAWLIFIIPILTQCSGNMVQLWCLATLEFEVKWGSWNFSAFGLAWALSETTNFSVEFLVIWCFFSVFCASHSFSAAVFFVTKFNLLLSLSSQEEAKVFMLHQTSIIQLKFWSCKNWVKWVLSFWLRP